MKKTLLVLFSLLLILGVFILEGGSVRTLLCASSFIPVFLGTFITTLFSFSWTEMKDAFRHAFSVQDSGLSRDVLNRDVQVVRSMSGAIMIWAVTIIILALIAILSSVTEMDELGPHIAVAFTALLYAYMTRTILLYPMETRLTRKLSAAD